MGMPTDADARAMRSLILMLLMRIAAAAALGVTEVLNTTQR